MWFFVLCSVTAYVINERFVAPVLAFFGDVICARLCMNNNISTFIREEFQMIQFKSAIYSLDLQSNVGKNYVPSGIIRFTAYLQKALLKSTLHAP